MRSGFGVWLRRGASACLALLLSGAGSAHAADGAPPPADSAPTLQFAFEELVTLAPAISPGATAYGSRTIIPITGGSFAGPRIKGLILPGGWDWQLHRADGCTDVKADYMLKTDDGAVINIVNTGVICPPAPGQPLSARTQPRFEAPLGKYDWLSKSAFIGTLEVAKAPDGGPAVRIKVYQAR